MRNARAKRPRGRPKSPATTELIAALIGRQDAMSARAAARINAFLADHIPAAAAEASWFHHCRSARIHLREIPARARQRLPQLTDGDMAVLASLVEEALAELGPERSDAPPPPPPKEQPNADVHRSTSLANARAQCARLQARWIDLKQRARRERT